MAAVTAAIALLVFGLDWGQARSVRNQFKPGYAHYQHGDYTAAEADFRRFMQLNPDAYYGHYYLGICLLQEDKTDEARTEIQSAIDHPGSSGGKSHGPDWWYYKGRRLLEVMKELPAGPTVAQREQWIAKHPKLFHPD